MKSKPSSFSLVAARAMRRLLIALAAVAVFAWSALGTEPGARALWQLALRLAPGTLSGDFAGGTLAGGIRLNNLDYRDGKRIVRIDMLAGAWEWRTAPLKLAVTQLRLGTVELTLLPAPSTPLPNQLTLPLAVELRDVTLRRLILQRESTSMSVGDIRLRGESDRVRHMLTLERADTPYGAAHAELRLEGSRPYAASGNAGLSGRWHDERFSIDMRLGGTLENLELQLTAGGDRLNGSARIEATPFAPAPLRRARLNLKHLNPQLFNASAPRADLDVTADLAPVRVAGNRAGQDSHLAVTGPVSLINSLPGPVDAGLLPVVSVVTRIELDAQRQLLSDIEVRLTGGSLRGDGAMDSTGNGQIALHASAIDPHALYSRLKPTRLEGTLRAASEHQMQRVALDLAGSALTIAADARIDAQRITLEKAQIASGSARLTVDGTLARDQWRTFAANGRLSDFNPARFFAAQRSGGSRQSIVIPDARINADFKAQGALQPEPGAQLQFTVTDSTYAGLPMSGAGRVEFTGIRMLAGDAQLAVAGNRLRLKGGFGAPPQHLQFEIDAPALERLGFGLSGLLQASGELGGSIQRPVVDARVHAERLAYLHHQVAQLTGRMRTQGVPGRNPDARLALELDARGLQSGDIALARLNAVIDGSYANHSMTLTGDGRLRGQPLALQASAHGNLQEQAQGYAWDGTLERLEASGIARLSLAQPVPVSLAPRRLALGAAQLTLEQARIDLKSLRQDDTTLASEGAFAGLELGRLLALQRELTGKALPLNTDLVLDGRWKLALADAADGFFQLERRGGDVRVSSATRETALGIRNLQLRGDMQGRTLKLALQGSASRVGSLDGQGELILQHTGGRLLPAPDSPLRARLSAQIPRLQAIASLAGPRIALDGSVAIELAADGTLAAPRLSGDAVGSNLALTYYDQGIRLHDGSARVRLDDGIVEVRQLDLRGGDGVLRITGRIPLDGSAHPSASIIADRLQLLSKPSAQLTISGRADAVDAGGQLEIRGKVRADNARFQLPDKSAPALDDDVLIVRGKERNARPSTSPSRPAALPPAEKPAGPLTPRIAIDFDLGDDFRFTGSGADVVLGGMLAIASAPGETPQATGTVHVVAGSYEAFGTRLEIERGTLNFHRSFANPDLNILAMRRDKEVAAGVQVTGTVREPRVQLVSEPEVTEEEKLSWLVFGRAGSGGDAGPAQAQAAAKEAALGLFNRMGGARIAKGFGLDQLALGSSEYGLGAQQVVSLGKEISNRLYIGYEQSLAGAAGVLKLTWDWSRHWSVVVRGGSIGGLDLLYNKRFDAGETPERR